MDRKIYTGVRHIEIFRFSTSFMNDEATRGSLHEGCEHDPMNLMIK